MNLFSGDDAVIQKRLRELCRFVRAHEHIADSHNVDFFTGDNWSRLPAHWQRQLLSLPNSALCRLPLAADDALSSTTGDLHQFLQSSRNLRLPNESHWYSQNASPSPLQIPQHAPSDPLQYPQHAPSDPLRYPQHAPSDPLQYPQHVPSDPQYPQHTPSDPLQYPQHAPDDPRYPQSSHACMPPREAGTLDHFGMTAKKSHEVKRMADMVHLLAKNRGVQQVLDLGSGRGYLSQYLAMRYSMSVVGVDAERSNTHSAVERNRKAMRALKNVFSAQKKDIIKNAPLRGRGGEAQTVLDRLPDGVGAEGMGIGAEPSPVEEGNTRDYEPPALQASTHLPANVTEATTTLEETHNQDTNFPIQYQSSTQCKQACSPCSHEHRQENHDVLLVGDNLLGPLRHFHDKDGLPGDGCCSLQHSSPGHEGSSLTTATVDSNSDPHSHIANPQPHSHPAYYTPMTGFLSLEDDPESVIRLAEVQSGGVFQRDKPTVLVGLHTCGDLAATCLKFFLKARQLTALCIVGCCYHHIREEGEGRGFPLSKFLLSLDFRLGRTMRMLALQSPDRLSGSEEGLGVESMFYRAVLQVILVKECHIHGDPRDYNIGKIYAKSKGFVDYVRRSLRKLELELPEDVTDERIQAYWREYQPYRRSLFAFHQMRATVAPCIEAVIVLDRLLFLRESGLVQRAECLSLFDPSVSPRTFAIVAEK